MARRKARGGRPLNWKKALWMALGIVLVMIGAFLSVAPGPGIVFFLPGALLLARESLWIARLMDGLDRLAHPLVEWAGQRWESLSPRTRRVASVAVACLSLASVAAGIYVAMS